MGRHRCRHLFVESRHDRRIEAESGRPTSVVLTQRSGASIELLDGQRRFASDLQPDQLDRLATTQLVGSAYPNSAPKEDATLAIRRWVEQLLAAAERALPGASFAVVWVDFDQEIVARSLQMGRDRRRSARVRLDGYLQKDGKQSRASAESVIRERTDSQIDDLVVEVTERLELRLDTQTVKPDTSTVVFAPGVGGVWIHELVGHAAEGDTVANGESWMSPGIAFFPPALTVMDDPRRGRGGWRIDDEGSPAQPTAIIRDGGLASFLHSNKTAQAAETRSSGHGRCSSFRDAVLPRLGCTFVANGSHHPDEIMKEVQEGIYVRRMESAHTDPSSGFALFRISDADRIEGGKRTAPLQSHLLETLAVEALAGITMIGNDLQFDRCIGSCHRHGQPLVTSVGTPTICTRLMKVRN